MMRLLIPVLLLVLGIAGGVGAGFMLAPSDEEVAEANSAVDEESASDIETADTEPDPDENLATNTEFVRLNSQFVVPIVHMGSVRSLVVSALSIEVPVGESETVFAREPRLRDEFLQVMFAHANAGGFDGSFTEAASMAPLRRSLRDAARSVLGAAALDVLIVDITRQDA